MGGAGPRLAGGRPERHRVFQHDYRGCAISNVGLLTSLVEGAGSV